jgi:threonine dehydratase
MIEVKEMVIVTEDAVVETVDAIGTRKEMIEEIKGAPALDLSLEGLEAGQIAHILDLGETEKRNLTSFLLV